MKKQRCHWSKTEPNIEYHDKEWGVPVYDDDKLFEFLILEGMQAGLSWITILKKRENMRKFFSDFNAKKIKNYTEEYKAFLLTQEGIIRNKLKINALVINAEKFLEVQKEFGSFSNYIWKFVDNKPIVNHWKDASELPTSSEISNMMSKDLKKRGFKFVGTTICYAFMEAVGLVNDHTIDCYRHKEIIENYKN
ncbi:MAG: DNA-3-methyladenine glycosylase I [Fusobacteriaceae bacterium]